MATIKIGKRIKLYIFPFCFLNFLFFSLRCLKFFVLGKLPLFFQNNSLYYWNAPLILKIFNDKTDIYFFRIRKLLFFSLMCFYLQLYC